MSLKHDFRQTVVIANIRLPGDHAPVSRDCLSRANTAMVFIDRNTDTHSWKVEKEIKVETTTLVSKVFKGILLHKTSTVELRKWGKWIIIQKKINRVKKLYNLLFSHLMPEVLNMPTNGSNGECSGKQSFFQWVSWSRNEQNWTVKLVCTHYNVYSWW